MNCFPIEQQYIYYTPKYYSLYEKLGDGKAKCFVYEKNGETLLYPFLINSVNDLGFKLNKQYFDIKGAFGYNGVATFSCEGSFKKRFTQHSKISLKSIPLSLNSPGLIRF